MEYKITNQIIKTVQNGIYYNPPGKHYGDDTLTVSCDMCECNNQDNPELDTFIGYGTHNDLCIKCVNQVKTYLMNNTMAN